MTDDIVERLTAEDLLTSIITSVWCKVGRHPGELADLMKEAADEITRLRAENEKLRAALVGMIDLAEAANVMDDPAYNAARKALKESGDE